MQSRDSIENTLLALEDDWDDLNTTMAPDTKRTLLVIGYDYNMLSKSNQQAMMQTFADQLVAARVARDDLEKYRQRLFATKRRGGLNQKQRARLGNLIQLTTTKLVDASSGIRGLTQRNRALVQQNQAEKHRVTQLARFTVDIDNRARQHLHGMDASGTTKVDKDAYMEGIQAEKAGHATDAFLLRNYVDPEGMTDPQKTTATNDILWDNNNMPPGSNPILDFGSPIGASMEQSEVLMVGAIQHAPKKNIISARDLAADKAKYMKKKLGELSTQIRRLNKARKLNKKKLRRAERDGRKRVVAMRSKMDGKLAERIEAAKREKNELLQAIRLELGVVKAANIRLRKGHFSANQFLASDGELELIGRIDLKNVHPMKAFRSRSLKHAKTKGLRKMKQGKKEAAKGARGEEDLKKKEARQHAKKAKASKKDIQKLRSQEKKKRKDADKAASKKRRGVATTYSKTRKKERRRFKKQMQEHRNRDKAAKKKRNKERNAIQKRKRQEKRRVREQYKPKIRAKSKEAKRTRKAQKKAEKEAKRIRKQNKRQGLEPEGVLKDWQNMFKRHGRDSDLSAGEILRDLQKAADSSRHPLKANHSYGETMASEDHAIDGFQELLAQKILDPLSLHAEVEELGMDQEDHAYMHDLFRDYAQEALDTVRPRTGPTTDPALSLHNISITDSQAMFDLTAHDIGEELEHGWLQTPEAVRAWHTSHAALKAWLTAIKHQQNWAAHTDPALARTKYIGISSDFAFAMSPPAAVVRKGLHETATNTAQAGKSFAAALDRFFSHIPGYGIYDTTV